MPSRCHWSCSNHSETVSACANSSAPGKIVAVLGLHKRGELWKVLAMWRKNRVLSNLK